MFRPLLITMLAAGSARTALAQAQTQVQRSGDFHWDRAVAAGKAVSIHNISGDITVTASTSGKVEVVGVKHGDPRDFDRIRAEVQETAAGVVICVLYADSDAYCDDDGIHANHRRRHDDDWGDVSMSFQVAVPTNLRVSAHNISGDVDVTGAHGDIEATSVSGDVRLEKLHADAVRATSVSGDVAVQVDQFTGKGDLRFRSVSGDVMLEAPRTFAADISMSTVSGDIDSDFPLVLRSGHMGRRRIDATIGAGGRRLEVSTVSGDLRIRAIN